MSETFVPLTVGEVGGDRFEGFIRANWVGRLMIAEIVSTAQDIQRTERLIRRADAEYFQVAMVARGVGRVVQDGREALLRPGDCAAYETTRPFRWIFDDDWDAWVFTFPRESVRLSEAERRLLTARRLDGRAGITGVVSRFLLDLGRNSELLSGEQAERVLAHGTDLVMTLLSGMAGDSDAVRSSVQRSLMLRIKDHIDHRLADPGLCPDQIAAAANISTRYLHKLFAAEHRTVSEYIRGLRLDRCRGDLLDPRLAVSRSPASHSAGASATSAASTAPSRPPSARARATCEGRRRVAHTWPVAVTIGCARQSASCSLWSKSSRASGPHAGLTSLHRAPGPRITRRPDH